MTPGSPKEIFARSANTDDYWRDGTPRCECSGECASHLHEDEEGRCLEQHEEKALGFRGDVRLAVVGGDRPMAACQRCAHRIAGRESQPAESRA